jgi:SAM-dependent methyltransferase
MKCRSCGGDRFGEVIDLGLMPLVNNLLHAADEIAHRYPLHVMFCRACSLMQLAESPPPGTMFDEYVYFSSQSATMVEHARLLVKRFLKPTDRVLEIASNDGYLLRRAQAMGATVLGIEPARNIAAFANSRGIPTRCEYFDRDCAARLSAEPEDWNVVFANNVLAHTPDPNEIVAGIALLLKDGGVAHIEAPSGLRMIQLGAFDTIYHEHYSYFSLTALDALLRRHDLRIVDVEMVSTHGGSFHLQVARQGSDAKARRLVEAEIAAGILSDDFYADFTQRAHATKRDLDAAVRQFKHVVGYGAAAKGVVLLNALGLDRSRIPWIADVSPHKQGRFVPGTGQAIVPPRRLLDERPDAALLLPWNIRDEVLSRNQAYRDQGGRFIVPIPRVEVL